MVEQHQLSNGIRVVCEPVAYAHSVAFGVWVRTGSAYESLENNGIAHMVEHMVFKRTKKRDAKQIADETAEIGGNLDACTSKEFTSYYAWVLKENLIHTIDLLGDMLTNSLFLDEDLEKEKDIVMEEIDMYHDSPEDVSHEMLQNLVWDNHPLGYLISGEKDIVEEFCGEDLKQFVEEFYTADNMIISIVGNISWDEIKGALEEAFGGIGVSKQAHVIEEPVFCPCVYLEEKDIEQVHLNIAYQSITSISEERYVLAVVNAILGAGVNSRLFLKVREEMGLAYAVYSYGSAFQKAGLLHLYAGLNANQFEPAMEAIGQEIKKLKKEPPKETEIVCAREQIKTDLIIQKENIKGRMNNNAREILLFNRIKPYEETIFKLNQVDKDQIIEYIQRWFCADKMAFSVVGNLKETSKERKTLPYLKGFFI